MIFPIMSRVIRAPAAPAIVNKSQVIVIVIVICDAL
jgi:hypothetical protein